MKFILFFVYTVCLFTTGCSNSESYIESSLQSAIAIEQSWEHPFADSKVKCSIHREQMSKSSLSNAVHLVLNGVQSFQRSAVPLVVKFERIKQESKCAEDDMSKETGHDTSRFRIDAVLFGYGESLLSNRFYFLFAENDLMTLWSRKCDNLLAGMGRTPYPILENECTHNMGTYRVRWYDVAPIFFSNEKYKLDDFLNKAVHGEASLCWHCGNYGLHEGKHIYIQDRLSRWLDERRETVIPLKMIFAANGMYIFSVHLQ